MGNLDILSFYCWLVILSSFIVSPVFFVTMENTHLTTNPSFAWGANTFFCSFSYETFSLFNRVFISFYGFISSPAALLTHRTLLVKTGTLFPINYKICQTFIKFLTLTNVSWFIKKSMQFQLRNWRFRIGLLASPRVRLIWSIEDKPAVPSERVLFLIESRFCLLHSISLAAF